MIATLICVSAVLIIWSVYRRWYARTHLNIQVVDYANGEFVPRSAQTVKWPPKWYRRLQVWEREQDGKWRSEDVAVDTEGP